MTQTSSTYNCGNASNRFTPLSTSSPGTCSGAQLVYADGTLCPGAGVSRSSVVNLLCNVAATTPYISSIRETSACTYLVEFQTILACGGATLPSVSPSPSRAPTSMPTPSAAPAACEAFPIQNLRPGYNFTMFGSTYNAPTYQDSCQPPGATVWYSLRLSPYSNVTLSTCNSYTNFNTAMYLRTGPCTNMQCALHNSGACGKGSSLTFTTAPDTEYFLSITGVGGEKGNFELMVSTSGPADPTCSAAVYLPGPYFQPFRIRGTNKNSLPSTISQCGLGPNDQSVWYHFSPVVGSPMIVSTCSSGTDFDTVVSVFEGSCSMTQCVTYNDNNCTSPGNSQASTVVFTPTSTSYFAVVTGRGGSTGYYQLYVQQKKILGYDCEAAENVAELNMVYSGNTESSGNLTQSVCSGEVGRAYWYHVTVAMNSEITISTCEPGTSFDTVLSVYEGSCNQLRCVDSIDDNCNGNQSQLTITRDKGSTFWVVVSGYQGATGDFDLSFNSFPI